MFSSPAATPPVPSSPSVTGPSEYTRMFSPPGTPEPAQMAAPVALTPAPKAARKQSSYAGLIVILAMLAVCALILIFYFARR